MNIFLGLIGVHEFFSFNFPLREYFFLYFLPPHPPHKFSNGPPLSLIQISSQGRSVAEIKRRKNGGSDLQHERLNTGMAPTCNWRIKIVII